MATQRAADPKLLRGRRYATGFPIRCTEQEKAEIFAQAARANRSASRFLVELAVRTTGPSFDSPRSTQELAALEGLMVQLRRVATNLQVLAHHDHRSVTGDGELSPTAADAVVSEIREVLAQIRERVV